MKQSRILFGLRGHLVGAVLVLLCSLLTGTAALVLLRAGDALHAAEERRFEAATRQFAESISYAVLARSEALLEPHLEVFARTGDLLEVEIRSEDRALIGAQRVRLPRAPVLRVVVPVRGRTTPPGDRSGELAVFGVATDEAARLGQVTATFSVAAAVESEQRMRSDIIWAFILLGGGGLVLVAVIASRVVRRVELLRRAAARVAGGDLGGSLDEGGKDELADLSVSFNRMTAALVEQHRALKEAATKLAERESLAAIGRATAVIAHELKNPLGILLGAAGILRDGQRRPEERERAGAIIEEEVRRLDQTLHQLLDYARPRSPQPTVVSAKALCSSARDRARLSLPDLVIQVHGDDASLHVDEEQIGQILLNLLLNAAQAGAARVTLSTRPVGERVILDVEDDGPGIDPGREDEVFRPFVTSKSKGAGLGLAASRRMADQNGAVLRVRAGRAAGACFELDLPRGKGT